VDGGLKFFGKALWQAVRNFAEPTINVCLDDVKVTDDHVGPAGDYALCHRCRKPISSKDGFEVRESKQVKP
jgi:hypothetical protein